MHTLTDSLAAALATRDEAELVDLNDFAVNTLRDVFGASCAAMYQREALDLLGYLRARRVGSPHRLSRFHRRLVFTVFATRRALAAS